MESNTHTVAKFKQLYFTEAPYTIIQWEDSDDVNTIAIIAIRPLSKIAAAAVHEQSQAGHSTTLWCGERNCI